MSDVTRIFSQIDAGFPRAAEQLLPLVDDELCTLAAVRLAHDQPGQTLQATALGAAGPTIPAAISSPPLPRRCGEFSLSGRGDAMLEILVQATGSTGCSTKCCDAKRLHCWAWEISRSP